MPTSKLEQYRVCDTDHPTEVLATQTEKFSLNGYRYEIDTCDDCSAKLYGAIMAFADVGRQVGEPSVLERARPARTASPVTPRAAPPPVFAERRRIAAMGREALPPSAMHWTVTEHCEERMALRVIDLYDVLMAAVSPEHVTPAERGCREYHRNDVKIIVDPDRRVVLTCARPSESLRNPLVEQKVSA